MDYPPSHLYFLGIYQVNTSGQCKYSMVYYERALHNYLIPCHRKYSGQHNQSAKREARDGKVGCNTVKYTTLTDFLYFDWLYFLSHGINIQCRQR